MSSNDLNGWRDFAGANAAYVLDLYDDYAADPDAVDAATRALFQRLGPPPASLSSGGTTATRTAPPPSPSSRIAPTELPPARPITPSTPTAPSSPSPQPISGDIRIEQIAGAASLANAIRAFGYRAANLDPLGSDPPGDAALRPETHRIRDDVLAQLSASIVGGPPAKGAANALEAINALRRIYQSSIGYEFGHVSDAAERAWLREVVESGRFAPPKDRIDERRLLDRLTEVGSFERFLNSVFPGQTRFSLEGLGMMIPMLDELIGAAAEAGTRGVFLGMAHRGRLNVLAHTLGKPYDQILAEFMGYHRMARTPGAGASNEGWTGDVKYHMGARRAYRRGREVDMLVALAPNPSHLEWINPVVEGMTRACDERRDLPGHAQQDELASLAVLIHGDAAFPGQGVVAETLNLSRLPGYRTGGTFHLIANNQLGFTTAPENSRSTRYASDLAKGFEIPVIHVNADDPIACIVAVRVAHAYRERFRKDAVIDLVGYRRWGHNEGDEPAYTQPVMYKKISEHPTVRQLWSTELERRGIIQPGEADAGLKAAIDRLHATRKQILEGVKAEDEESETAGLDAGGVRGGIGNVGVAASIPTAVSYETLCTLNSEINRIPDDFHLHPKLEKLFQRRRARFGGPATGEDPGPVDWAHAEALAFGSIVSDAMPIRLTGQDVGRGTFSQRHAILHDSHNGEPYISLQRMPSARASFEIWDSPLSECATLGFEFGYSIQAPEALILWEAQYGDFVDVPQPIIDLFIASAKTKWGQCSGMVMLLPHGYEGAGPEHSSARPERFLQLVAEDNLRIANCTTAAQYFHILRRQARLLTLDPRPLILMSPKSLLRNPLAGSPPDEFTHGGFKPVLDDQYAIRDPERVRRLVLCSGKVYYDVVATGQLAGPEGGADLAVARVEELYPFPATEIEKVVNGYPNLKDVVWLQEEPRNMGAWTFVAPRLRDILTERLPLSYAGRTRRSSPAEGYHGWHKREQARIVEAVLKMDRPADETPVREVQHAE